MDRFNSYTPDGESTADRWAGALHLFDQVGQEETWAERGERARLIFEEKDYAESARLLSGLVEEFSEQVAPQLLLARAYYHSAQLRKQVRTTISEPSDTPVPDLFRRDFAAPGPNTKYMGDIMNSPTSALRWA